LDCVGGDKRPARDAIDGLPEDATLALVPPLSKDPLIPDKGYIQINNTIIKKNML
jgi:hypothetical protein